LLNHSDGQAARFLYVFQQLSMYFPHFIERKIGFMFMISMMSGHRAFAV